MSAFWHHSVAVAFRDLRVHLVLDPGCTQRGNREFSWGTTPFLHLPVNLAGPDYPFGKVAYQTVELRERWACGLRTMKRGTSPFANTPFLIPVRRPGYQNRIRGVLLQSEGVFLVQYCPHRRFTIFFANFLARKSRAVVGFGL